MFGWLYAENIDINIAGEKGTIEKAGQGFLFSNLKEKFTDDYVKTEDGLWLEGFVSNKKELMNQYSYNTWDELHMNLLSKNSFPAEYRGSFCGYDVRKEEQVFFTDHLGSKSLYYYINDGIKIVSTKLYWIVQVLKAGNKSYSFDETAAKYMLTYGFMIDDTSFVKEVKRVLPGSKISVSGNDVRIDRYYIPTLKCEDEMSEKEALEKINDAFRNAVKREFEKDCEKGYKHLVDLSGGLDSRMVTWVAHDLGYMKQTNISYCKANYLDYHISSEIAQDLKHEFYYRQLDDIEWFYDIDEILRLNNGQAFYSGITCGKRVLENIKNEEYGIEHTGMVGDVVISCFAKNKESACSKPVFGKNQYSNKLKYDFDLSILEDYDSQESFDIYNRGFLGAMSTYATRQNYFEVSSPFLDVDFMNTCMSLPIEYRCNHKIYLKWIEKYYPDAAKYGWEKWLGLQPKERNRKLLFGALVWRKIKRTFRLILKKDIVDDMYPFDYWYNGDGNIQTFFTDYFNQYISSSLIGDELRSAMEKLFSEGSAMEKTQVLTVLGMIKNYF